MKHREITIRAAAALLVLFSAAPTPAHAQGRSCLQSDLVGRLLADEAGRIGAAVETLRDAHEVARYIDVINEQPPLAGPAERLLILVHPTLHVARVFLVHRELVCERYLIGPEMHRKAWVAARGFAI